VRQSISRFENVFHLCFILASVAGKELNLRIADTVSSLVSAKNPLPAESNNLLLTALSPFFLVANF